MTQSRKPDNSEARPDDQIGRARESWSDRCSRLFGEMRRPARAMVARAYGRSLSDDEIDDVYSAAWAATLSALRERGQRMREAELRAYILTAVASHASKEMRRRTRKPMQPLEPEREATATDSHAPLPDEIAIGTEARGVARDLLTSLPVRRRAVMLLDMDGGSVRRKCVRWSRASRRAPTAKRSPAGRRSDRGFGEGRGRRLVFDRQPLIRDLVAGTADESARRQALEHLDHCRACSDLAARLGGRIHEIGGMIALSTVSGCIGGSSLPVLHRLGEFASTAKAGVASKG